MAYVAYGGAWHFWLMLPMMILFFLVICAVMFMVARGAFGHWGTLKLLGVTAIVLPLAVAFGQPVKRDVTLRGIMSELGGEYLRIIDAILRNDDGQVAESASAIAHHPMPENVVSAVKKALGPEFVHFDEIDEASHAAALALHDAAGQHDNAEITRQAGALLSKCTECHTSFRIKLRPLSD